MIQGKWHPAGSSAQSIASLEVYDGVFKLTIADHTGYSGAQNDLVVSDRIGNVERKITLEDGSLFVTGDNDGIDALFKKQERVSSFLHRIESHMGWVAVGVVVTIISAFSFFKWGIPWASEKIAHALPQKTNTLIGYNSLKFLDKYVFKASKLEEAQRHKIRAHFKEKLVPLGSNTHKYTLHFRSWSSVGKQIPNAFALPSGDIVVTDKFVQLARSQEEIDSVLLHEMGHVERRHSLEMLIEGTFVTVAVMLVIGDVNGIADLGIGMGTAMISSNYSRGHEAEADSFAFKKMLLARMDPEAFSRIMNRMTVYMEGIQDRFKKKGKTRDKIKQKKDSVLDYLSSHPSTESRVERARQYSACFKKGLTKCEIVDVK